MGHRYEDLAAAVGANGPFASEGDDVRDLLDGLKAHESLRADLAHGVSCVALKQHGEWIAIFRRTSVRKKELERTEQNYRQADADQPLKALRSQTARLCTAIKILRQKLGV